LGGAAKVRGFLTTHVLDTAHGRPAAGLHVEVFRVENEERRSLNTTITNCDGRTDTPLLDGGGLKRGRYEIVFHVGAYFAESGVSGGEPPFLDRVPVRFGVSNAQAHYHVPLLVSPWSYATYRGS
jgi:5-hydroxyisourate hydrolase